MNQSLVVYWTKIGTFWPWCPRESFIILGSQIVPDNNHVVPCHVIICSGQSRRYCVKLEKVDSIGSTNLIITRGSRLKQKENKWWAVFSVFWASASRLCLGFLFGVYAWGLWFGSMFGFYAWGVCLGCLLRVSAWGVCLGSLLWVSDLYLCFGSLLGSVLLDLCFQVSVLGLCFGYVSASILSLGSLLWVSRSGFSYLSVCFWSMHWVANIGLCFGSLQSLPEFHFFLRVSVWGVSWFFLCFEFSLGVSTD